MSSKAFKNPPEAWAFVVDLWISHNRNQREYTKVKEMEGRKLFKLL